MDALKFLKEFDRMCNHYVGGFCAGCPRKKCSGCNSYTMNDKDLMELISDVERWSKEHPQKTRLQDFKEKYPNAPKMNDGTPIACCASLWGNEKCKSSDFNCVACWNKPVEDDE